MRVVVLILFLSLAGISCGLEQYCISYSNKDQLPCKIQIKCPKNIDFGEKQLQLRHLSDYECCSRIATHLVFFNFYLPFDSKTSLKRSINLSSALTGYPLACLNKKKYFNMRYYGLSGIHKEYKVVTLGSNGKNSVIFTSLRFKLMENDREMAVCSRDLNTSVFQSSEKIDLNLNAEVKLYEDTCIRMFTNASISELTMDGIADSLVKRNLFGIGGADAVQDLSCFIGSVFFKGYQVAMTERSFPTKVFSQTSLMQIRGTINRFEARILCSSNLNEIDLSVTGLRKFLHNNPNWLDFANERSTNKTLGLSLNQYGARPTESKAAGFNKRFHLQYDNLYEIEEKLSLFEDNSSFCIFYQFKRKNLNVRIYGLLLEEQGQQSCDCTLFWLLNTYMNTPSYTLYYGYMTACESRRQELEKECDFDAMGARCQIQTIEPVTEPNSYSYVWNLKLAEYVLNTIMASALNSVAVLVNLFVILVFRSMRSSEEFRKKKLTDKNQPLWDYVYFNTFFVLLQALIFALEPLTACIEYDGIYCSPFILTYFGKAFYLFVQSYLANVLKIMANVTNTLFVLYRYGINKDRLAKFRKRSPLKIVMICMCPALSISIITLFVNERFDMDLLNKDEFVYLSRVNYLNDFSNPALEGAYLINKLLGCVVFIVFNLFIDLRLLLFLRTLQQARRKEEAEARITKMIVLNGLFSFLFRMPEMVASLLFVLFTFYPLIFPACILSLEPTHSACPSLSKISQFFYSFSFYENCLLLVIFNPEFKTHAVKCFSYLKKTLKCV
nr:G protein-coupled receptor [Proales similis]